MLKENCIIGLPVRILSKSTGQDIEDLNGVRIGAISKAEYDYGVFNLMVAITVVDDYDGEEYEQNFSFIPEDLTPLWGDTQNG